jgi:site-specific DNA-methyltransferase (adenine-specific)
MHTRRVNIELWQGDCLDLMHQIPDGSIDMVLCDLPYGTTACKWDSVIPFEPLWEHYRRVVKPNGAIVLFASQPFTSALVMSNPAWFRYDLVWDKVNLYTGTLNANRMPLRRHETILVFYRSLPTYNKQYRRGKPYRTTRTNGRGKHTVFGNDGVAFPTVNDGRHYPCSVIEIPGDVKTEKGYHPTQKPVDLLAYLIRTYTNEGETVLDNAMGSGSTGVACVQTERNFIGIQKDEPEKGVEYFEIARARIQAEIDKPKQYQLAI